MKKNRLFVVLLSLCLNLFLLSSCTKKTCTKKTESNAQKFNIVASSFICYDFARAICGENVSLKLLIKPGTEVHSFDPSPLDIISLEKADLFIYCGGESDKWAEKLLSSMKNPPKNIFRLVENVNVLEEEIVEGMEESEDDDETSENDFEIDEHVWTAPQNAIILLEKLSDLLCRLDSSNQNDYRTNAQNYIDEIKKVQAEIRKTVASKNDPFIVMGDRFPLRYFVEEFGIDYRAAFPGCSSAVEASPQTIAYLIDTVKQNNLPAVFTIELSNQKIAKAVAEASGAKVIELNACHNLTKAQFSNGFTYLQSLHQNNEALKEGLR